MQKKRLTGLTKNHHSILRLLYNNGSMSRMLLAKGIGVSFATITKLISDLISKRLVEKFDEYESTGGRKPSALRINPNYGNVMGLDIGGYSTRLGLLDMGGKIIDKINVPTKGQNTDSIIRLIRELLGRHNSCQLLGIGAGISGLVDHKTGKIIFCPNVQEFNNTFMADILHKEFMVPVYVDTSARYTSLAEYHMGSGTNYKDQIYISVGYGVGCGIIINSEIFRGGMGFSGELGHVTVDEKAGRCTCGNYGCLEMVVTFPIILEKIQKEFEETNPTYSPLRIIVRDDYNKIDHINTKNALKQNDKTVYKIIVECGKSVGIAVSSLATLFNPNLIILGGSVISTFSDIIMDEIRRTVAIRTLGPVQAGLEIKQASLGEDGGIIGGGLMVIKRFIEPN